MPRRLPLLLLLCACLAPVAAAGEPAPRHEQGILRGRIVRELEGSQWALAEDAQGRIYSSGNHGVAVFDGDGWTQLPLPHAGEVRGLGIDGAGRIWVGSSAELGYFTRGADGTCAFTSIRPQLAAKHADYGQLWDLYVVEDAVFFVADQQVMRWREGGFTVWPMPSHRRLFSSRIGSEVYVHARGVSGLWRIGARDPQPISVVSQEGIGRDFGGCAFIALLPEAPDSLLLFAATQHGPLRLGVDRRVSSAGWPTQDFFVANQIEAVCRLAGGRLAVATWRAGVVLTDASGRALAHINKESGGLPDNRVNRVLQASNQRLWIATRQGLAEWDIDPAITYFTHRNGLVGEPSGFARYLGDLYATTDLELLRVTGEEDLPGIARLAPIPTTVVTPPPLLPPGIAFVAQPEADGRKLRFAEMDGVACVEDGRFDRIIHDPGYDHDLKGTAGFAQIAEHLLVVAAPPGLSVFEGPGGAWVPFSRTPLPQCRQVLAEPGQPRSVIVRTGLQEIWRATIPARRAGAQPAATLQCLLPRASAREIHQLYHRGGAVFALTANGTWRLTPGDNAFVQTEPARPDPWVWAGAPSTGAAGWILRRQPSFSPMAGASPLYALHYARPDPAIGWRADATISALVNDLGTVRTAWAEADGVLWIAGSSGIARVDTTQLSARFDRAPAMPVWRRIRSQGRLLPLDNAAPLEIPAGADLGVEWSAPSADRFAPVLFQTQLAGVDAQWSAPSPATALQLERLRPGRYSLAVRSASPLGRESAALSLAFTIAPAWYQSGGAIVVWLGLGGAGLYALIGLRTRGLRQRQRELEAAVQRRTNELQATKDVLQQTSLAKTEFISTVSHELRTPLTGARMMADVLLQSSLDPAARARLTNLRGCLTYLQQMLDETLDLSRLELGHVPFRLTRFRLGQLVGETCAMFEAVAAQKGLAYRCDVGNWSDRWYQAEATHLQRVLLNFLSNALKFTPQGAITLSVSAAQTGPASFETLRFTVTDTGPGVAPGVQERIFRAFVRHNDPRLAGETPGTGLGLALCRKLADLNGGQVGFTSAPGAGAAFWVEWPLLPASPDPDQALLGGRDFSQLRVLVVEDDPNLREATTLLLQEFGVIAATAGSVDAAEQQLRGLRFDVVLVDYNLGGATGIDLIDRCRRMPGFKAAATRFHLITAHSSDAVRDSARQAGFASFHSKPISAPALYGLLAAGPSAESGASAPTAGAN